jgi:hypothetical protein
VEIQIPTYLVARGSTAAPKAGGKTRRRASKK